MIGMYDVSRESNYYSFHCGERFKAWYKTRRNKRDDDDGDDDYEDEVVGGV